MPPFVQQRHPINRLLMEKLVDRLKTDGTREVFENTESIIQYISACYAKDDEGMIYLDKYELHDSISVFQLLILAVLSRALSAIQNSAAESPMGMGTLLMLAGLGNHISPTDALRSRIISEASDNHDHNMTSPHIIEASKLMMTPWLREDDDLKAAVLTCTFDSAKHRLRDASFPRPQIIAAHHAIYGLDHFPMEILGDLFKHPLLFDGEGRMVKTAMYDNRLERIKAKRNIIQIVGSVHLHLGASYPKHWPEMGPMLLPTNIPSLDHEPGEWNERLKFIQERIKLHLGGGDDLVHEGIVLPHFTLVSYVFATDSDGRPIPVPDSLCRLEHMTFR